MAAATADNPDMDSSLERARLYSLEFHLTRAFVMRILENWDRYHWTIQGLGMLRTYINDEIRLHIWDNRYAVPNVSRLHDHPWDFESLIVSGRMINQRYTPTPAGATKY